MLKWSYFHQSYRHIFTAKRVRNTDRNYSCVSWRFYNMSHKKELVCSAQHSSEAAALQWVYYIKMTSSTKPEVTEHIATLQRGPSHVRSRATW